MNRKSASARAVQLVESLPASFTFRPAAAFNVRVREFLLQHSISFNELCEAALTEYLTRHPSWQRRHLRLPRGKRPRT